MTVKMYKTEDGNTLTTFSAYRKFKFLVKTEDRGWKLFTYVWVCRSIVSSPIPIQPKSRLIRYYSQKENTPSIYD